MGREALHLGLVECCQQQVTSLMQGDPISVANAGQR
jgi:hypothetical protein